MTENKKNETAYRKIDNLQVYVLELENKGSQTVIAEKTARIAARRGEPGEKIISWSVDSNGEPVLEKEAVVSVDAETGVPGWVVTKLDEDGQEAVDQNGNRNEWIIDDTTFQKKYEPDPQVPGIFRPVGGQQKFIRLCEAIHIIQWGKEWKVDAGGFINITKAEDMYVISGRDFADTYRVVEKI